MIIPTSRSYLNRIGPNSLYATHAISDAAYDKSYDDGSDFLSLQVRYVGIKSCDNNTNATIR